MKKMKTELFGPITSHSDTHAVHLMTRTRGQNILRYKKLSFENPNLVRMLSVSLSKLTFPLS